jgi:hypothetical protein
MSHQEKHAIVSLFSNLISSSIYFFYLSQNPQASNWSQQLDFGFWSSSILIYLLVVIIFKIIIIIIFAILNAIITREEDPGITDEMDKLIEMKATGHLSNVFMIGVLLSLATVLVGLPPASIFIGILASLFIGGIVLDVSTLRFYQKGVY